MSITYLQRQTTYPFNADYDWFITDNGTSYGPPPKVAIVLFRSGSRDIFRAQKPVSWIGPNWWLAGSEAAGGAALMLTERMVFRRVFGGLFRRVN